MKRVKCVTTDFYCFWFFRADVGDAIIVFLMECNCLHIVKHTQQMCLNSMRIGCLPKNLKEGWVGHEEEAWEDQSLLFQVASEGLLAELQLLQEVGQELAHRLVPHTALHHIGRLVSLGQYLHPRLVNVLESLGFLWKSKRISIPPNTCTRSV